MKKQVRNSETRQAPASEPQAPVPVKLTKSAAGQFIQFATGMGKHRPEDISPAALAEILQAGLLERRQEPLREDQTLEAQVDRNKEALAKLALWARTACPKDPFKGKSKNGGWNRHPIALEWDKLAPVTEYKACYKTVISDKGWEWLLGMGVEKPKPEDADKPCGSW